MSMFSAFICSLFVVVCVLVTVSFLVLLCLLVAGSRKILLGLQMSYWISLYQGGMRLNPSGTKTLSQTSVIEREAWKSLNYFLSPRSVWCRQPTPFIFSSSCLIHPNSFRKTNTISLNCDFSHRV